MLIIFSNKTSPTPCPKNTPIKSPTSPHSASKKLWARKRRLCILRSRTPICCETSTCINRKYKISSERYLNCQTGRKPRISRTWWTTTGAWGASFLTASPSSTNSPNRYNSRILIISSKKLQSKPRGKRSRSSSPSSKRCRRSTRPRGRRAWTQTSWTCNFLSCKITSWNCPVRSRCRRTFRPRCRARKSARSRSCWRRTDPCRN